LAAQTFRPNPRFDTQAAITEVGVGEAVVSVLQKKGTPSIVERTLIRPPSSRLGPCDDAVRQRALRLSPVAGLYDKVVDRESAFELLRARAERRATEQQKAEAAAEAEAERDRSGDDKSARRRSGSGRRSDSMGETIMKSVIRSAGSQLGRTVVRSLIRGLFR
jgi:hypothetical protein